jgi:hypothetical protein
LPTVRTLKHEKLFISERIDIAVFISRNFVVWKQQVAGGFWG